LFLPPIITTSHQAKLHHIGQPIGNHGFSCYIELPQPGYQERYQWYESGTALASRQRRVWLVGIGRCLVVDALHVLHAVSKMNTFEPNADRREIFNFRAPAVTKSFRLISDKDMGGIFGELCMLLHQQPIVDWSVLVASRLHNSRVYARSSCRVCNLERPARYHSTKSKDGQEWLCCHHLTGMIRSLYCLS
jgi:hypothetical protein